MRITAGPEAPHLHGYSAELGEPEQRADVTVTIPDELQQYLAGGADAVVRGSVAAVEAVSGRVAGMLSMARVEGRAASRALTPTVLRSIAMSWVQRGESLHVLWRWPRGMAALDTPPLLLPGDPTWTVWGGPDPASWWYEVELCAPSTYTDTWHPTRDRVLHVLRDPDSRRPWRGRSPLGSSKLTHDLAVMAETALLRETRIPSRAIVPMPSSLEGLNQDQANALRQAIQDGIHAVMFPPTTMRKGSDIPQTDWKAQRIQAMPDQYLVALADAAQARVVAAMGVHPQLLTLHGTAGTAAKEAVRQFHDLLVLPIGRAVEEEASRLFREPVRLRWDVGDDRLLIRGRMLAGLLKDGVDSAVAWQVSRLDESAPMPTITPPAPKAGLPNG